MLELGDELEDRDVLVLDLLALERGKPAPDLYLLAAQRMNTPPQDCVAIEDSPVGVAAACAAGASACRSSSPRSAS